jgi:hypothetical protein
LATCSALALAGAGAGAGQEQLQVQQQEQLQEQLSHSAIVCNDLRWVFFQSAIQTSCSLLALAIMVPVISAKCPSALREADVCFEYIVVVHGAIDFAEISFSLT